LTYQGPDPDVTSVAEELLEELLAVEEIEPLDVPGGIQGLLYRLRVGIEAVTRWSGNISWVLVWVVFALGLFNVITRYVARFIERDIIVGEIFDLQWMLFGVLFLVALNYGVREGVNPRIDFWWANFSLKRKAIIDLVLHTVLFLPFLVMAIRTLWGWSLAGMGRKFAGSWATCTGW
jgi:TRAP-type mannitol/chloroaromatic compound transport system permease small subunit